MKSVVEDRETQLQNMALTQSKSVSELSQIKSLAEFPIPDNIERLISRSATNKTDMDTEQQRSVLISRIKELEQRVGDLETRLSRLEGDTLGRPWVFMTGIKLYLNNDFAADVHVFAAKILPLIL